MEVYVEYTTVEAAGSDGTWIIALYAQDDERNVTDRYTLTASRLVVQRA